MYEDDAMDEDEEVDEEMYTMEERDVIRRAVQERWEALDALEARRLKLKRKQERRFRLKMDFMKVEIEPIVWLGGLLIWAISMGDSHFQGLLTIQEVSWIFHAC